MFCSKVLGLKLSKNSPVFQAMQKKFFRRCKKNYCRWNDEKWYSLLGSKLLFTSYNHFNVRDLVEYLLSQYKLFRTP